MPKSTRKQNEPTGSPKLKSKRKQKEPTGGSSKPKEDDNDDDETICCVLCHVAVDFADRTAFFESDRQALLQEEDDPKKQGKLPNLLLPESLYDASNTFVFCDTCNRPYHQRCHFVPLITIPRGEWHCLLCQSSSSSSTTKANNIIYPHYSDDTNNNNNNNNAATPRAMTKDEWDWEFSAKHAKLHAFGSTIQRLTKSISQQMQQLRLAQATLAAYNNSRNNKQSLTIVRLLSSQELCQTFVKLATSKLRVRQWLQSLNKYIQGTDEHVALPALYQFVKEHTEEIKFWFPLGLAQDDDIQRRRLVPKFDKPSTNAIGMIPLEVTLHSNNCTNNPKSALIQTVDPKTDSGDVDDDMISLEDLKCCICFKGDATDENDVLMCDGQGCFRAYHMQCLKPVVSEVDDDDWFCPLCTTMANLVANVQSEYTGDEWVLEDADTIHSWNHVGDVFPESENEYEMAMKWKEGDVAGETAVYLASYFGVEGVTDNAPILGEGSDSDDEDDDDFHSNESNSQGASLRHDDGSSQDMSSVELNIPKDELDALSAGSSPPCRRAKRNPVPASVDAGALDESNIIHGKRRRQNVDYRRLNDAMFGALKEEEMENVDDAEDFEIVLKQTNGESSDDSSDASDNEDDDNEGESSNDSKDENEAAASEANERLDCTTIKSTMENSTNGDKKRKRTNVAAKKNAS